MGSIKIFFFLCVVILVPAFCQAFEQICSKVPEVIVLHNSEDSIDEYCEASAKALTFLEQLGLKPKKAIYIEIIEKKIESRGYIAYGSYDSRIDRIQLMSYQSVLQSSLEPKMYGEPFDKVHYSAAIAHEVTHAVVQHNLQTELISTSPQEYLAHATQLAVMPEDRRNEIIEKMAVDAWMPGDAISDIYMAIEPGRFAVKSYKHLTGMSDPAPFVNILLNAKWFYVYVP